jgi:hypothetical protein
MGLGQGDDPFRMRLSHTCLKHAVVFNRILLNLSRPAIKLVRFLLTTSLETYTRSSHKNKGDVARRRLVCFFHI